MLSRALAGAQLDSVSVFSMGIALSFFSTHGYYILSSNQEISLVHGERKKRELCQISSSLCAIIGETVSAVLLDKQAGLSVLIANRAVQFRAEFGPTDEVWTLYDGRKGMSEECALAAEEASGKIYFERSFHDAFDPASRR